MSEMKISKQEFRNPAVTVDLIIENDFDEILLIQRGSPPFEGEWALPGGYLEYYKETLEKAGVREGKEETDLDIKEKDLKLFGVYSDPYRDPRDHVISITYIVRKYSGVPRAGDDARRIRFFRKDRMPKLAFDHNRILDDYLKINRKEKYNGQ